MNGDGHATTGASGNLPASSQALNIWMLAGILAQGCRAITPQLSCGNGMWPHLLTGALERKYRRLACAKFGSKGTECGDSSMLFGITVSMWEAQSRYLGKAG
jgi:hypothetical protein